MASGVRRIDGIGLGDGWDHLERDRDLPAWLARATLRAFLASIDRRRHAVLLPSGQRVGHPTGPCIRIVDEADLAARLFSQGSLGFGEAFIAGSWCGHPTDGADDVGHDTGDVRAELDTVADWLTVYAERIDRFERSLARLARPAWNWRLPRAPGNDLEGSKANVSAHYDLPVEFFRLFLDDTLTYSCGLFTGGSDLRAAQVAKVERLLDLADVRSGRTLLDVGCGWGFLAAHAARSRDVDVVGITLSGSQAHQAREMAREFGVADRVRIEVTDYRLHRGEYDAIVSVEMLEAVGSDHWADYAQSMDRLCAPDGRVALQAFTYPHQRMLRSKRSYSWVHRYIFPGGELISLTELDRVFCKEATGRFEIQDMSRLSSSYAVTLRQWRHRFSLALDQVRDLGFDDNFIRVWLLYLAYFEAGFRARYLDVWQLGLVRPTEFAPQRSRRDMAVA
jgi:cyclopropane-fatty-acyl-phospholipid synthase